MINTDLAVFLLVLALRLFIPLLIPRLPLVGVVLALIIDGVDQTIFQQFTNIDLTAYQSYDKALDIYYLSIAYISIFRNWTNISAIKIATFLWYYRLVGVLLFELTYSGEGPRYLLFLFPNTFEYFFIFYEIVASFWNPIRLTMRQLIKATAFIWIFIKLPQEYWIHIAQNDTTDMLKEKVFHVPLDATFQEILATNMWLIPFSIAVVVGLFFGAKYLIKRLPPKEWNFKVLRAATSGNGILKQKLNFKSLFDRQLLEKITLVSFVAIIFSQIAPTEEFKLGALVIVIAVIIFINTVVTQLIKAKGLEVKNPFLEFIMLLAVNTGIFAALDFFSLKMDVRLDIGVLFYLYLLSIIVALYDWYFDDFIARFQDRTKLSA